VITTMSDQMTGDMKDEMRAITRENLDEITVNSADDLTTVVVRESKNAVSEVTRKKEKKDDEAWWKEIDLSFLKGGKEGITNKFIEFVRPHIRRCGDDINQKISKKLPEHAKSKLREKLGFGFKNRDVTVVKDRGIHLHEGGFKHLMEKFRCDEGEDIISKTFDKIFQRLPEKLQEMLEPHIKEFEEKLLETLHIELYENIFKEDNFLGSIKSMINRDKDGDGKNDFVQGVSHANTSYVSFFTKFRK
ncbi:3961_t:CDS:2, partial [Scutellospora calospora]